MAKQRIVDLPTEVLLIVFQCLSSNPGSLAAVAQSCKYLSSLALSQLWNSVDVVPLNYLIEACVPLKQVKTGVSIGGNGEQQLPSAGLDRFVYYASFIKEINLRLPPRDRTDDDKMLRLANNIDIMSNIFPSSIVFPSLQVFQYRAKDVKAIQQTSLFLGMKLNGAVISLVPGWTLSHTDPDCGMAIATVLDLIPTRAPHLRGLVLMLPPLAEETSFIRAVVQLLQALPHLSLFGTGSTACDPELFRAVAHYKGLRTFQVLHDDYHGGWKPLGTLSSTYMGAGALFETLEEFYMYTPAMVEILPLMIPYMRQSPLKMLILGGRLQDVDPVVLTSLANSIGANCAQLQVFSLNLGGPVNALFGFDTKVDWKWFTGLVLCRQLTLVLFVILVAAPFDVSDRDIDVIGEAWPRLREFHLEWNTGAFFGLRCGLVDQNSVTLASILSLARHCPQLETIFLSSFQTATVPTVAALDLASDVPLKLLIHTSRAEQTNARNIALFLSALRPRISLAFHDRCSSGIREEWDAVCLEMAAIRARQNIE